MTRRLRLLIALGCALALPGSAQTPQPPPMSEEEQQHLRAVLAEGSSSPTDLVQALETHLAKYPGSPRKYELERAILKAAIQARDQKRIALYGERVLVKDPGDVSLLEPVCRALVAGTTLAQAKAALEWSRQYESAVRELMKELPGDAPDRGRKKDELDRLLGRSLTYQALAAGNLGDNIKSAELARKSFEAYPSGEPAVELGKRLALLGRTGEAIRAYADAFAIPDPQATDADRAVIRLRLGELYQKWKGSETGLGDIILQAYDRTSALIAERKLALRQFDPNMGLSNPMEYTLTGLDGEKLALPSLRGKVVVMDFWATWCGPCRVQHPLYGKVKERFKSESDVVFLAISTDEDRAAVKPFVQEHEWGPNVYYEDGLARVLRVSSIPTTVVFGRDGAVVSRMNGFDPATFVDALSHRIDAALAGKAETKAGE
jgi:thiol-disulfide isomerase/thioredoxin